MPGSTEHPTAWVIHRHPIPFEDNIGHVFGLPIVRDAQIIHVALKDGWPNLWERHKTNLIRPAVIPERHFRIVPTGMEHTGTWHGSFIDDDPFTTMVWHLVELEEG